LELLQVRTVHGLDFRIEIFPAFHKTSPLPTMYDIAQSNFYVMLVFSLALALTLSSVRITEVLPSLPPVIVLKIRLISFTADKAS
jgi:hypothetical protein